MDEDKRIGVWMHELAGWVPMDPDEWDECVAYDPHTPVVPWGLLTGDDGWKVAASLRTFCDMMTGTVPVH